MLVDVEPLYFMLTHQYPIHRFLHTYVGATVAAGIVVGLFVFRRVAPRLLGISDCTTLSVRAVALGAHCQHVARMSARVPSAAATVAPFSAANPLLGAVLLNTLHGFCLLQVCRVSP